MAPCGDVSLKANNLFHSGNNGQSTATKTQHQNKETKAHRKLQVQTKALTHDHKASCSLARYNPSPIVAVRRLHMIHRHHIRHLHSSTTRPLKSQTTSSSPIPFIFPYQLAQNHGLHPLNPIQTPTPATNVHPPQPTSTSTLLLHPLRPHPFIATLSLPLPSPCPPAKARSISRAYVRVSST